MGCDPNDLGSTPRPPSKRIYMQNAAFQEGYKAFQQGKPVESNPYTGEDPFMIFELEWDKGWEQGWRESELFS
jgi:ribosome modulation factor